MPKQVQTYVQMAGRMIPHGKSPGIIWTGRLS